MFMRIMTDRKSMVDIEGSCVMSEDCGKREVARRIMEMVRTRENDRPDSCSKMKVSESR